MKYQVDVIYEYTDLAKAFDIVNYNILIKELSRFGLNDNLVNFYELCWRIDRTPSTSFT